MLKIGVVGVGHLGQHHVRIFKGIPGCKLVGIYDKNEQRAAEIADKYEVKVYSEYEKLLNDVDAIDIVVTTSYHYKLAKTALEKSKHVFIEKPITSTLDEAKELLIIAKEKNLEIQVGHIERFNPIVIKVAPRIENPRFIEAHRLAPFSPRGSDVSVVLDLMIHDIDLILSFVKSTVTDIRATGVRILTPSIDIANARLEFANGTTANVTASRISTKRERKIRFFQSDAYLSLDFHNKNVTILKRGKDFDKLLQDLLLNKNNVNTDDLVDLQELDASDIKKDALTLELESFVDCISSGKKPTVDGKAGTEALKIASEISNEIKIKDSTM